MTTTPKRPAGRTLAEFQPLHPGEEKLLEACRTGGIASLGKARPEQSSQDNRVRAAFVRFLALGGDAQAPVHERGVQLFGARIEGELDLDGAQVATNLSLFFSHFDTTPLLRGTHIRGSLNLAGSLVPGLEADRLVCEGSVFLKEGFSANDEVRLLGAQIGANLECDQANFERKADSSLTKGSAAIALAMDGAVIKGSVFLRSGFSTNGVVRLHSTQISGTLDCRKAHFGNALVADGMRVEGGFAFRNLRQPADNVSLNHARVGQLLDDKQAWGDGLMLDGFVYGSLAGGAPTDAASRLAWLNRQRPKFSGLASGGDFRPQPWRQLQKVLSEMGHAEDARRVAIAFEDRLRKAEVIGATRVAEWRPGYWLASPFKRFLHWLFGLLLGYGYRPLRMAGLMLLAWLLCAVFFWQAALQGAFAPSDPLVFQHPDYAVCAPGSNASRAELAKPLVEHPVAGAGNWYLCTKLREEYTGFSPLAYSLDVILPLVDLQQERDWSPLIPTPSPNWGIELITFDLKHWTRLVVWFEILFGWVASLLLVAVVSGLTKRRED